MRQQVELQFSDGYRSIVWIDADLHPRAGMGFTGKDGRTGTILAVFPSIVSLYDINRLWKVGGIV